ncbi:endoglin [Dromiciops gliroides]|uniref:endoglin n=1 Tax=Dromiciops gliroides TaxID=33562 RepID=UPI001CC5F893|nr:endoglin [Dromiciops gliroides]
MEGAFYIAMFLAACSFSLANALKEPDCDLELPDSETGKVTYTTNQVFWGCLGKRSLNSTQEVHVLNLRFLKSFFSQGLSELELTIQSSKGSGPQIRPPYVVLGVQGRITLSLQVKGISVNLFMNPTKVFFKDTPVSYSILPEFSTREELLDWAQRKYGNITSYAEIDDPQSIILHLDQALAPAFPCVPESNFNMGSYLTWKAIAPVYKGCYIRKVPGRKVAHIVKVMQSSSSSPQIVEVKMNLSCPLGNMAPTLDAVVILQGPPNVNWLIDSDYNVQIWTTGEYSFKIFPNKNIPGSILPDTFPELLHEVHKKFNASIFASYVEIPFTGHIALWAPSCAPQVETSPSPVLTTPSLMTCYLPLLSSLLLPQCSPDSMTLVLKKNILMVLNCQIKHLSFRDPSCQSQEKDDELVLSSSFHGCGMNVKKGIILDNEVAVTLTSSSVPILTEVECLNTSALSVHMDAYNSQQFLRTSSTIELGQRVYVQVTVTPAAEELAAYLDTCSLDLGPEADPVELIYDQMPKSPRVKILTSVSNKIQFSFLLRGHMVPTPTAAILNCNVDLVLRGKPETKVILKTSMKLNINNPTLTSLSMPAVLGITFGAFIIGALLTAALWYISSHTRPPGKRQPVMATVPASESSSTNHSIGSTQSTPCSTSSMA